MENKVVALLAKTKLIRVVLNEKFVIAPYLNWFDQQSQQKISSYYHYRDRLIAFTSNLLQKYYLAFVTNCPVSRLVINYSKHHKPYISLPEEIARGYNFNIAHTYNQVILAVYAGNDYQIGVDIEKIDTTINIDEMAPIVFSAAERKLINNQPHNFFKLWTKKESIIKALGTGFATDFYQDTNLNLDNLENTDNYHIITSQINDYFLSICLYKMT
jgi:4'-phosphopantetheinyl transferase